MIGKYINRLMTNYQKAFDLIHPKQPKLIKRINTDPTDPSSPDLDQDLPCSSLNTSATLPPPIKFTLFKTQFESVIGWVSVFFLKKKLKIWKLT
jgi:hypothetical protein